MTIVALATAAAAAITLATVLWALYVLFDIGSDGLGAGPWHRPEPAQTHTRLPADFIGLWSLFGARSINALAGSRESALRRLARLEANLQGRAYDGDNPSVQPADGGRPAADSFDPGWLERRVSHLEALAGITSAPVPTTSRPPTPSPSSTAPPPARGRP